ncbi:phosphatidylglycerol lysyltransferase domain-containing protein, partial [Gardnerella vaginalis]
IAYRLKYGVALTLTGPFGDKTEYKQDLKAFIQLCEQNSWSPAFYAVHDEERKALESIGFSSIKVGSDMLVYPKEWQTRGKKWQDIRTAINKA